jgi:hypothetical protein
VDQSSANHTPEAAGEHRWKGRRTTKSCSEFIFRAEASASSFDGLLA